MDRLLLLGFLVQKVKNDVLGGVRLPVFAASVVALSRPKAKVGKPRSVTANSVIVITTSTKCFLKLTPGQTRRLLAVKAKIGRTADLTGTLS